MAKAGKSKNVKEEVFPDADRIIKFDHLTSSIGNFADAAIHHVSLGDRGKSLVYSEYQIHHLLIAQYYKASIFFRNALNNATLALV